MTRPIVHYNPLGRHAAPRYTGPSAAETTAELERAWREHLAEAAAKAQADRNAEDTRLEITAVELYGQLGKAIGGITTEQSWVDLATEIERLVEAKGLSSRHGTELHQRLLRVAKDRGWLRG